MVWGLLGMVWAAGEARQRGTRCTRNTAQMQENASEGPPPDARCGQPQVPGPPSDPTIICSYITIEIPHRFGRFHGTQFSHSNPPQRAPRVCIHFGRYPNICTLRSSVHRLQVGNSISSNMDRFWGPGGTTNAAIRRPLRSPKKGACCHQCH